MIPYGKQDISKADISAVCDVLASMYITQGPKVAEFEQALCDYTGAKHCIVVASGTAALHLSVAALNLPEGSEGITSANTFAATANSMVYCGLIPVFADIDSASYNIDPCNIAKNITPKTSLIIPVHFAGQPANMELIKEIADQNNLRVIEDAAHAIGSSYKDGSLVGCCKYSDATIFSFHPVKTITCGEGGAILTNDSSLYEKILLLRNHGITKDVTKLTIDPGPWFYEMQTLGWHYRMTDIQAALGLSQLKRLNEFKAQRRASVARYNKAFSDTPWITIPHEDENVSSCFHLYVILIDFIAIGKTRSQVMDTLFNIGIGTQVHYIPVYHHPWYQQRYNYQEGMCPITEKYYQTCLSLPLYSTLSNAEQDQVIDAIRLLSS
ncbi:UDP-4-amino-4,6-dideoxy-N-acetyl-beta-L-altrosamine transaminase [Aeromonas veronii]|uniref:UDP-4-amino-4, 6-dideoxy-N-acetyl-beta-L-altrosamine transaminase n=1 Tax=Aeromonas veronii TaxID=654 RepID=UPI000F5EA81E|nr:UDP-4-amino-4,6-dideoxy-N-acetyl-beta-L-altrosamine transaminase [Aeromonas veronii]MBA2081324.1 UDP-4-amino-4,6-dideoxy-N-acetyl-beta-L-altrosamine transaminase [Aeromonas veronii]MCX0421054.1 UDP-4-amino-4,6-dideoxy-N-acetyl-beta-L-altrosamine transaminase [Aeromonas veronii]MCX0442569.1 UDP-4-amino-4,6-dideoxy-N-acetyl-beta-L-altrosamine transaminase [Aeromonas veronii]RRA92108.1 UDP-4-amino-4,6-dideoxy-N-acetyl-beta-L-altrosamine transaminase [Aeromonas veronii bv. sobria]TNI74428.1 UDP